MEEAFAPDARQLLSSPLSALLERAEQLLIAAADDIAEVQAMLGRFCTAAQS